MQKSQGFHLIEIISALAITSIVLTFAYPLYSDYLLKTNRLAASTSLQQLANAMEKYHLQFNTYENATLAALHFPEKIPANYKLSIQSATLDDYVLIAEPLNKQAANDNACGRLILHANDKKAVSGSAKAEECWS
jgi:type IV pilus assembly protein PilE